MMEANATCRFGLRPLGYGDGPVRRDGAAPGGLAQLSLRVSVTASSSVLGIKQPMHVHDEIAHVGVVDGLLRLRLPGRVGGRVVRIDADDIQLVEILELEVVQILQLATKDKVQKLLGGGFFSPWQIPSADQAVARFAITPVAYCLSQDCLFRMCLMHRRAAAARHQAHRPAPWTRLTPASISRLAASSTSIVGISGTVIGPSQTIAPRPKRKIDGRSDPTNSIPCSGWLTIATGKIGRPDAAASFTMPRLAMRETFGTSAVDATLYPCSTPPASPGTRAALLCGRRNRRSGCRTRGSSRMPRRSAAMALISPSRWREMITFHPVPPAEKRRHQMLAMPETQRSPADRHQKRS